jgi:heme-degrading monooxygenase HmoA
MHARVNATEWNPERVADAMQLTEDTIIPAYQKMPGFRGYILLTEPEGEKAMAITMWDTEEQMDASAGVARAMVSELKGVLRAPPQAQNYEVRFYVQA